VINIQILIKLLLIRRFVSLNVVLQLSILLRESERN